MLFIRPEVWQFRRVIFDIFLKQPSLARIPIQWTNRCECMVEEEKLYGRSIQYAKHAERFNDFHSVLLMASWKYKSFVHTHTHHKRRISRAPLINFETLRLHVPTRPIILRLNVHKNGKWKKEKWAVNMRKSRERNEWASNCIYKINTIKYIRNAMPSTRTNMKFIFTQRMCSCVCACADFESHTT